MSKKEIDHMADLMNNLSQAQRNFERIMVEVLPDSYLKPVNHLNNAQIEVLKAINSLIENRIEGLEYISSEIDKKSEVKHVRKEKVEVE
jgi:hypothetical protein